MEQLREAEYRNPDRIALWLSLVPGLGHLYKGYVVLGGAILFLIGPLLLVLSMSVLRETFGLSLIVPVLFLAAVMFHAYRLPDHRHHVIRKARAMNVAAPHS